MKTLNPRIYPYLLVVAFIVSISITVHQCRVNQIEANNWKGKYDYTKADFDSLKNKKGIQVVEQQPGETYNADDVKKISSEIFDLKKSMERKIKEVNAFVKANQIVRIRDSLIKYYPLETDPIDTLVPISTVVVPPRKFNTENKNYSIAGTVLLDGVKIDSIKLNNTVSFRIAEKKNNFLSSRKTVVQVINSNPLFNTSGIQSIVLIKPKQTTWNKYIKPAAAALVTIIIKNQLKRA